MKYSRKKTYALIFINQFFVLPIAPYTSVHGKLARNLIFMFTFDKRETWKIWVDILEHHQASNIQLYTSIHRRKSVLPLQR